MSDRIERQAELKAPISRVWRALADYREFGEWFGVNLEAPFAPGQVSRGRMTYPGYEHVRWEAFVEKMDYARFFSFTWPHPKSPDQTDYAGEPTTLVEFRLERAGEGTLLSVVESGFEQLPADRRDEAFRSNEGGWTEQMKNISNYLDRKP